MNDGIEIRSSNIHGRGVYALRAFRQGEAVIVWDLSHEISRSGLENLTIEQRKYVCRIDDRYILMQAPAKYVNHSCNPNTAPSDEGKDVAVRDIEAGEEITSNYSGQGFAGERVPCLCGALNCAGFFMS